MCVSVPLYECVCAFVGVAECVSVSLCVCLYLYKCLVMSLMCLVVSL